MEHRGRYRRCRNGLACGAISASLRRKAARDSSAARSSAVDQSDPPADMAAGIPAQPLDVLETLRSCRQSAPDDRRRQHDQQTAQRLVQGLIHGNRIGQLARGQDAMARQKLAEHRLDDRRRPARSQIRRRPEARARARRAAGQREPRTCWNPQASLLRANVPKSIRGGRVANAPQSSLNPVLSASGRRLSDVHPRGERRFHRTVDLETPKLLSEHGPLRSSPSPRPSAPPLSVVPPEPGSPRRCRLRPPSP